MTSQISLDYYTIPPATQANRWLKNTDPQLKPKALNAGCIYGIFVDIFFVKS